MEDHSVEITHSIRWNQIFNKLLNPVLYHLLPSPSFVFTFTGLYISFLQVSDAILHSSDIHASLRRMFQLVSMGHCCLRTGHKYSIFPLFWLNSPFELVLVKALCTGYYYSMAHSLNIPFDLKFYP